MKGDRKLFLYAIPILALLILGLWSAQTGIFNVQSPNDETLVSEGVKYKATVCTNIIRADGTIEEVKCSHNLLTNVGKEHIEGIIGQGWSGGSVVQIGLCNASIGCSTPAVGDTTLENEYGAGGLSRSAGTYGSLGTGNWSVQKIFTATASSLQTNKTGIFNASSGGTLFAENTFTLATLQTSDQLNITWIISVT